LLDHCRLTNILRNIPSVICLLTWLLNHATNHTQTRCHSLAERTQNRKKYMNKIKLTLIFMLLFSLECFSQQTGNDGIKNTAIRSGIGLGSVLAVVVSWERNKSVLLAFLHGIFSWLYVLYFVLTRKPEERHKK